MSGRTLRLLAAPLALLAGCARDLGVADEVRAECQRICDRLDRCGLLPSALGSGEGREAEGHCALRCELTESRLRSDVSACLLDPEPGRRPSSAGDCAPWRGGESVCLSARDCLRTVFAADVPVVGTGDLVVRFGVGEVRAGAAGGDCRPARVSAADEGVLEPVRSRAGQESPDRCTPLASGDWCAALNVGSVRVFVLQDGRAEERAAASCETALSGESRFRNLMPGTARPGAKLAGACPAGVCPEAADVRGLRCHETGDEADTEPALADVADAPAPVPWCVVVYGEEVVARAGDANVAAVLVPPTDVVAGLLQALRKGAAEEGPAAYRCEESAELCANGLDDEQDGLVDCDDPDCDPFCREDTPARCSDGVDNDGDGPVDCEDPDCALLGSCGDPEVDAGTVGDAGSQ